LRILLIASRYFPHRGGLESVVYHLSRELQEEGHTVRIITNRYPHTLPAHEIIDGISVTRLHFLQPSWSFITSFRLDLFLAGLFFRFRTDYSLKRIIREFQPDVVNSHYLNEQAEFTGRVIKGSKKKIPWVISLHGGDVDGEPHLDRSHLDRFRRLVRQADKLTACSGFLAKKTLDLEVALADKILVIHNGVDFDLFSKASASAASAPYILALGQLVQHKGFDLLIDAFALVCKKYKDVNLIIAGEGEFRFELERHIKENDLDHRVMLVGRVDSNMAAGLMAGSLFIAMPSRREPFGIVALEGLASGKCVLATPVGGILEFLPCPPNRVVNLDIKSWADALEQWLVLSRNNSLVGKGNQAIASKYDWQIVTRRYLQVYKQAGA
jgi:glycosyltransferase involved in cell wall biosynthesis